VRYDDRFLDDLKSRLRLSDIIGRSVKLRRQGREFVGLSPFNKERTPSFFVNDDKGFFHDFSSGKHGDLITFLQETERLTFAEAVERLAAEAGVSLPEPTREDEARSRRRASLGDWLETAGAWFQAELRRPVGREARAYLESRGLPEAQWARFNLGFAPAGRTALKDHLIAKGALPADLIAAGLLVAPEDGSSPYDRFRDRIMFPIADGRGRVVSFGGRAMDPQARAKYLNGPDTDLFDKSAVLYGLPEARRLLHAGGEGAALVVVEGYMDVIACQRAGVAAVAPMGTSLTEPQMEALWRLHPEPTLCFDSDRAGRQAASRAMDRALIRLAPGRSFRFATVEGGKDPDDILREQGEAALKAQLSRTIPFIEALFLRERDAAPLATPEDRTGLKQRLRAAARGIADPDLAIAYRDDLLKRFDALYGGQPQGLVERRDNGRRPWSRQGPPPPGRAIPETRDAAKRLARGLDPVAAALAWQAVQDPQLLDEHLEALQTVGFGDPALDQFAKEIIRLRLAEADLDTDALQDHLAECGFRALLTDVERAAAFAGAPFITDDIETSVARSQWSRAFGVVSRVAALEDAIGHAKQELSAGGPSKAFIAFKLERDRLCRAIASRTVWTQDQTE
jgi:DNA primase